MIYIIKTFDVEKSPYISELYADSQVVSFEMFPPKKADDIAALEGSLTQIAGLNPDFISVTCGAGGSGNSERTIEIASRIQREHGIHSLAHVTCVGAAAGGIAESLDIIYENGIRNVLALRGDLPDGSAVGDFCYAYEMIEAVKARGDFCIGAACYPEGHITCGSAEENLAHLLRKEESGADFFVSQLFFDNEIFFRFLDDARHFGVTKPISAGVMPILSRAQIEKMIFMCGASLPSGIIKLLHKYEGSPDDLRRAGIEYAARQLAGLLEGGADGIHVYTMNRPDIAAYCMEYLGLGEKG